MFTRRHVRVLRYVRVRVLGGPTRGPEGKMVHRCEKKKKAIKTRKKAPVGHDARSVVLLT